METSREENGEMEIGQEHFWEVWRSSVMKYCYVNCNVWFASVEKQRQFVRLHRFDLGVCVSENVCSLAFHLGKPAEAPSGLPNEITPFFAFPNNFLFSWEIWSDANTKIRTVQPYEAMLIMFQPPTRGFGRFQGGTMSWSTAYFEIFGYHVESEFTNCITIYLTSWSEKNEGVRTTYKEQAACCRPLMSLGAT